jgi:hypothetical protein
MGLDLHRAPRVEKRARIHELTLRRRFVAAQRPVVFGRAADHWKARDRWSEGYFRARYGASPIPCAGTEATLSDLFEAYEDQQSPHLWGFPLRSLSPELSADVGALAFAEPPWLPHPFIPRAWTARVNASLEIEIGGPGSVSPLRSEPLGGYRLETQLVGRQRVALLPPEIGDALEPRRAKNGGLRSALPELERVERRSDPALSDARILVAELEPGDTLFVPPGWWHEGKTAGEVAISVASLRVSEANFGSFLRELWRTEGRDKPVRGLVAQLYLRAFGLARSFRSRKQNERIACVR